MIVLEKLYIHQIFDEVLYKLILTGGNFICKVRMCCIVPTTLDLQPLPYNTDPKTLAIKSLALQPWSYKTGPTTLVLQHWSYNTGPTTLVL